MSEWWWWDDAQCKLRPTYNLSQYENSINQQAAAADGTTLYGPMRAQLCLYGPMRAQPLAETTTQDGGLLLFVSINSLKLAFSILKQRPLQSTVGFFGCSNAEL